MKSIAASGLAILLLTSSSITEARRTTNTSNPTGNANVSYRLERTFSTGRVTAEQAISSNCTLYADGNVTISQSSGNLSSRKRDKLALSGDWRDLIAWIDGSAINTSTYPADANSISYRLIPDKLPPHVKMPPIVLFEQNGGTGTETVNISANAETLRNFMDLNCGPLPLGQTPAPQTPSNFSVVLQFHPGWEYLYANTIFNNTQPTVIRDAATLNDKWALWFDANQRDGSIIDNKGNVIYRGVYPAIPKLDFSKEMLIVVFRAEKIASISETATGLNVDVVYHIPTSPEGGCITPQWTYGPSIVMVKLPRNDKDVSFSATNIEVPCGEKLFGGPKSLI